MITNSLYVHNILLNVNSCTVVQGVEMGGHLTPGAFATDSGE